MLAYINIFAAILSPIVAILGTVFLGLNWRTNEKKRKNELFDRRYDFYKNLRQIYLDQDLKHGSLDWSDWAPFAEEASFLFGDDIAKHIMSLETKHHGGFHFFPDENFIAPGSVT